MEVECDAVAETASSFTETCFKDMSIDKGVGELMDILRSTADVKTPATNFIALGRDIQKMIKKCSEFQKVYEEYKTERESHISKVRSSIEEEKKQLDLSYRAQAQEMKRHCQEQLDQLEKSFDASSVCFQTGNSTNLSPRPHS
ncbi:uncharacterized protein [Blastocystis hominis]|uniref:Uncharacterized protein n=1 Tax=Blastocystis hominis TaxID=12968 RepID=D8LVM7_BLAHO|nr:uncharacterized protein [Blastocystis hominis]CBK19866.2 unnamed protein product [Blastocystis hominis]|eukprot:XP_012893914.1 uncharacterized protein [Blastocystis hominis]